MFKLRLAFWLAIFAAYFPLLGMAKAEDDNDLARLQAETKVLFRTVLADESAPQQCELSLDWDRYPIPENVAREYLGLKLHAELSSPFSATNPQEILELNPNSEAFCSREAAKKFEGERLKEFETSPDKTLDIVRTDYTFPVFDEDYQKAILVVSHSQVTWHRTSEGIKKYSINSAGYAAVYILDQGVWKRLTTVELFFT